MPVLSVQRMSMEPRFWMAFRFLMMTFFLLMATAPLARFAVTIIGSISGVRPTATEMANSSAESQSPFVKPLIRSTAGTMTSMKRINTQETELIPFSKLVLGGLTLSSPAMLPSIVLFPTATATALALPLTTLLPIKARSGTSVSDAVPRKGRACFSTGSLSPVMADWLTNRSLAESMRTSAGTMSPAESQTISPAAISSSGSSVLPVSCLSTQAVVRIMPESLAAAFPLRVSCTKRRIPESITMAVMIATVA